MKTNFLGIRIDILDEKEALRQLRDYLTDEGFKTVCFLNAHCFNVSQNNVAYKNALNNSTLVLNDGIGVKIGLKMCNINEKANMNGTDFIPKVIKIAADLNKNIYLLGGKPGMVDKVEKNLRSVFPSCNIVGKRHGYFYDYENTEVIEDIVVKKTDLIIVGMGVPIQELWLNNNKVQLNSVKLGIAGGAILDFLAGDIKRAPEFIRKIKLEWLFRLCLEPRRLWKRYVIGNVAFFYYISLQKRKILKR